MREEWAWGREWSTCGDQTRPVGDTAGARPEWTGVRSEEEIWADLGNSEQSQHGDVANVRITSYDLTGQFVNRVKWVCSV